MLVLKLNYYPFLSVQIGYAVYDPVFEVTALISNSKYSSS